MFQGFNEETIAFLWGVRFNNEKGWFEQNKPSYINNVYEPIKTLGYEVFDEIRARFPEQEMLCKVSRIYRDARRLHGRGPYKDHLWFVMHRPKDGGMGAVPCFYFEIAPEYHSMGMGYYNAAPLTMAKFRARIDRDPAPVEKLARRLNQAGAALKVQGIELLYHNHNCELRRGNCCRPGTIGRIFPSPGTETAKAVCLPRSWPMSFWKALPFWNPITGILTPWTTTPCQENEQDNEPLERSGGSLLFGKVFQNNGKRIVISYKNC